MPDPVITVLSTAVADTGPTQTMKANFLKKAVPLRMSASLGSGDTILIEGKAATADTFEILHTFSGGDETPVDVFVSRIWRARRSVDGGADSVIKVENTYNQQLTAHA